MLKYQDFILHSRVAFAIWILIVGKTIVAYPCSGDLDTSERFFSIQRFFFGCTCDFLVRNSNCGRMY